MNFTCNLETDVHPLLLRPEWPEDGDAHFRYVVTVWHLHTGPKPRIRLDLYRTVKKTPCGRWLTPDWMCDNGVAPEFDTLPRSELRFVSDYAIRRWAYPTKAGAWSSFVIRQLWREKHARKAMLNAVAINRHIDEIEEKAK